MHQPFGTMGSGSLAAMSVLETNYRDDLTEQETIDLVKDALEAGIFHDLGSGSNVNIYSVKREGVTKYEKYREYNKKEFTNSDNYKFEKGTTEVLETIIKKNKNIKIESEVISIKMDLS